MKQKIFPLVHADAKESCLVYIGEIVEFGKNEVVIRDIKISKTMRQLGTLFGLWMDYLVEQTGYTKDAFHNEWKQQFLARIYCDDPQGEIQEQWVDLLFHLQEKGDWEGVHKHAQSISLAWCSINQMKRYLNEIQNYYISLPEPMPLPIPDELYRFYK